MSPIRSIPPHLATYAADARLAAHLPVASDGKVAPSRVQAWLKSDPTGAAQTSSLDRASPAGIARVVHALFGNSVAVSAQETALLAILFHPAIVAAIEPRTRTSRAWSALIGQATPAAGRDDQAFAA